MRTKSSLIVAMGAIATISLAASGCASETTSNGGEVTASTSTSFDEWKKTVYQESDTGVWVVDGDTPISSVEKLQAFYEKYVQQGALIVDNNNGVDSKWSDSRKRDLTYCVSKSSFGTNYNRVVKAMTDAGNAWTAVTDVKFVHVSAQDGNCTVRNNNVLFNVRIGGSGFSGRAFFPNDGRRAREVLIGPTAAGGTNPGGPETLTGLLRHELGHSLGFRHEHTRPQSGATNCFEDDNWRELTAYDSGSVMHYPWCNGSNTGDLSITALDASGAAKLYGQPR